MWIPIGLPTIMPPHCRTPIRRPKKARKKEKDEPPRENKLRRHNTSIHCSKCGHTLFQDTAALTVGRGRVRGGLGASRRGRGRSGSHNADTYSQGASQVTFKAASSQVVGSQVPASQDETRRGRGRVRGRGERKRGRKNLEALELMLYYTYWFLFDTY